MFDCRRITLFCLENASQSTKWLFSKNFGGHGPFAPHPCLRLCPRVSLENLHVFLMHYTVKKQINNLEYARVVYPSRTAKAQIFVFWDNFGRNSSTDCPRESITMFACQATVRKNETTPSDVIVLFGLHVWKSFRSLTR